MEIDCIEQFGNEKGNEIFQDAETIYQELLQNADYRNSDAIRGHMQLNLFPTMAYYKALRLEGLTQDSTLEYVRKETQKVAYSKKGDMSKLAKMPFTYTIYRMGVKKHIHKNFPDEGWKPEWVVCNNKQIQFNLHRCVYVDLTHKYECPELCCVFCENDNISFSGLLPKIRFERTGTLESGAPYCDFCFTKV